MQDTRNRTYILIIILTFSVIFSVTILYFVFKRQEPAPQEFVYSDSNNQVEETGTALSDFFKIEPTDTLPASVMEVDEEITSKCILDGVEMREGTVSGDTVCVNDDPVTPQSTR